MKVTQIIRDGIRPIVAKVSENGKEYLVNISDSSQMTREHVRNYAESLGVRQLPVVSCIKKDRPHTIQTNPASIDEIKNFVGNSANKDAFVFPLIINDGAEGPGHTVYMVITKENGKYKSSLLNQTANINGDELGYLQKYASDVRSAVAEKTGVQFESETRIIAGAFPSESNSASCTEIGVPLLKALVSQNPVAALNNSISSCRTTPFTLQDIADARFNGSRNGATTVEEVVDETLSVATAIAGKPINAKNAFVMNLKLQNDISGGNLASFFVAPVSRGSGANNAININDFISTVNAPRRTSGREDQNFLAIEDYQVANASVRSAAAPVGRSSAAAAPVRAQVQSGLDLSHTTMPRLVQNYINQGEYNLIKSLYERGDIVAKDEEVVKWINVILNHDDIQKAECLVKGVGEGFSKAALGEDLHKAITKLDLEEAKRLSANKMESLGRKVAPAAVKPIQQPVAKAQPIQQPVASRAPVGRVPVREDSLEEELVDKKALLYSLISDNDNKGLTFENFATMDADSRNSSVGRAIQEKFQSGKAIDIELVLGLESEIAKIEQNNPQLVRRGSPELNTPPGSPVAARRKQSDDLPPLPSRKSVDMAEVKKGKVVSGLFSSFKKTFGLGI